MYSRAAKFLIIASISMFISCAASGSETDEFAPKAPSIAPEEALLNASEVYKERADLDKAREAIGILGKARNSAKRDYNVEWKFARYSYFLGNRDEISENERTKVLNKGIQAARIALRLQPEKADGHFWYGAILGEQAKRSPVTVGLVSLDKIRTALKKSIKIDPSYQNASGYVGLGQLELSTLGLAGGSGDKALEYLEKALEIEKENGFVYLRLAEAYLAVKEKAKAKKHLDFLVKMKAHADYEPEHTVAVKEGKLLLKRRF